MRSSPNLEARVLHSLTGGHRVGVLLPIEFTYMKERRTKTMSGATGKPMEWHGETLVERASTLTAQGGGERMH